MEFPPDLRADLEEVFKKHSVVFASLFLAVQTGDELNIIKVSVFSTNYTDRVEVPKKVLQTARNQQNYLMELFIKNAQRT